MCWQICLYGPKMSVALTQIPPLYIHSWNADVLRIVSAHSSKWPKIVYCFIRTVDSLVMGPSGKLSMWVSDRLMSRKVTAQLYSGYRKIKVACTCCWFIYSLLMSGNFCFLPLLENTSASVKQGLLPKRSVLSCRSSARPFYLSQWIWILSHARRFLTLLLRDCGTVKWNKPIPISKTRAEHFIILLGSCGNIPHWICKCSSVQERNNKTLSLSSCVKRLLLTEKKNWDESKYNNCKEQEIWSFFTIRSHELASTNVVISVK